MSSLAIETHSLIKRFGSREGNVLVRNQAIGPNGRGLWARAGHSATFYWWREADQTR